MSEFINNASQRKDKIKKALKRIHDGEAYEDVKQEFAEVLSTATAQEISDIEQTLIHIGLIHQTRLATNIRQRRIIGMRL